MQVQRLQLKFRRFWRAIAFGFLAILLFWMVDPGNHWVAVASPLPSQAEEYRVENPEQVTDLEEGANRAEEASEQVYEGLDETQQRFGGAESTKALIEQGRETARSKLKSLSARAKESQNPGTSRLSPTDVHTLNRLQTQEPTE